MKPYLRPRELQVLMSLRRVGTGGIMSREALAVAVYGPDYLPSDCNTLKTFIYHLRKKGYEIEYVRGLGYLLGGAGRCPLCGSPRVDGRGDA